VSFQGDPYRILGVPPGASLNEIRAAYRRMAKRYHPDAAGERALARFLAIQGAYERLVDGEGRLRRPGMEAGTERGAAPGRRPAEPWRADPSRARASRDAWRARRAGAARAEAGSVGADAGATGTDAEAARRGAGAGGAGSHDWARPGSTEGGQADPASRRSSTTGDRPGRRGPRRATPGSTTYDEAADVTRDPSWDGGKWYGPSLGTYWTINPREYADPRKHGPEYQARARRAGERPPRTAAGRSSTAQAEPAGDAASTRDQARDQDEGTWTYAADADAAWASRESRHDGGTGSAEAPHATWTSPSDATTTDAPSARPVAASPEAPIVPDLESLARRLSPRNLLELARRGWRWRAILALVGWAPIGLALGSLLTSITGCAQFAASCPAPVPTLALLIQPLIPLVLALAPPIAALAAFGTLAALVASVPLAAVLAVGTGPSGHAGAPVLAVMVAAVYLVAIVAGAIALWRPAREP
jgi:curved DNA-binding protein CbpA